MWLLGQVMAKSWHELRNHGLAVAAIPSLGWHYLQKELNDDYSRARAVLVSTLDRVRDCLSTLLDVLGVSKSCPVGLRARI